jgi:flagellar hook-length control protein FliK
MQFFPPVQPGPVQIAQFGGMSECLEAKAGQGFEDLLSAHLKQADAGPGSPSVGPYEVREAIPAESVTPNEFERSEARREEVWAGEYGESVREKQQQGQAQTHDSNRTEPVKPAVSEQAQVNEVDTSEPVRSAANEKEHVNETNASGSAKPAASEKEQPPVNVEEISPDASFEDGAVNEGVITAAEVEILLSESAGNAEELLPKLIEMAEVLLSKLGMMLSDAVEVKGEGQRQLHDKVTTLTARVQDLLRQFRQSDPATRVELVRALTAEVKSGGQGQLREKAAALTARTQTAQNSEQDYWQSGPAFRAEQAGFITSEIKSEGRGQVRDKVVTQNAQAQDLLRQFQQSGPAARAELGRALAAEVKSGGQGQLRSNVATLNAELQAAKDQLRQFRQSDPAVRAELAASLGKQVKTLRDELVAFDRTKKFNELSLLQNPSVASGRAIKLLDCMEYVARRMEAIGSSPRTVFTAVPPLAIESRKVLPSSSWNIPEAAVQKKFSRHGGSRELSSGPAVSTNVSDTSKRTGDADFKVVPAREDAFSRSSQLQESQRQPVKAQPIRSSSESTAKLSVLPPEGAETTESKQPGSSAMSQESSGREDKVGRGAHVKPAVVTGAESVQATNAKSVVKGQAVAFGKLESGPENRVGMDTVVINRESSEMKPGGGREGLRLSAAPDRDQPAVSKIVANGTGTKIGAEAEAAAQTATSGLQTPAQSRLEASVNARTSEVYRQVENGAFKNLGQGLKQLVIRLDPADLGQVSVILQVRGKEVQAVLRASSQETSQVLNEQLGQLRTQLESQGLKVNRLEVQTQLSDSQTQSEWQGAEQHNRFQENRELALTALRWRTLGQADSSLAQDVQNIPQREKNSSSGLDIFA